MFSQVCVKNSVHRGVSVPAYTTHDQGVSVQGSLSSGVSVQGGLCPVGSLSGGVSVQGGLCPRRSLSRGLYPGGLCLGGLFPGESQLGRPPRQRLPYCKKQAVRILVHGINICSITMCNSQSVTMCNSQCVTMCNSQETIVAHIWQTR